MEPERKALWDTVEQWENILEIIKDEKKRKRYVYLESESDDTETFYDISQIKLDLFENRHSILHECFLCEYHKQISTCPLSLDTDRKPRIQFSCGIGCSHYGFQDLMTLEMVEIFYNVLQEKLKECKL